MCLPCTLRTSGLLPMTFSLYSPSSFVLDIRNKATPAWIHGSFLGAYGTGDQQQKLSPIQHMDSVSSLARCISVAHEENKALLQDQVHLCRLLRKNIFRFSSLRSGYRNKTKFGGEDFASWYEVTRTWTLLQEHLALKCAQTFHISARDILQNRIHGWPAVFQYMHACVQCSKSFSVDQSIDKYLDPQAADHHKPASSLYARANVQILSFDVSLSTD